MDKRRFAFEFGLLFMIGILSLIMMSNNFVEVEGVKNENPILIPKTSTTYYYCYNQSDIENAITSIGTGEGIIVLANQTIKLTSTIFFSGGGNYTIESYIGSTIDCGDNTAITVTSAISCVIKNLNINAIDFTSVGLPVLYSTQNSIHIENITIIGDGNNHGIGIWLTGDDCYINECDLFNLSIGIQVYGDHNVIKNNTVKNCPYNPGIVSEGDHNLIIYNNCSGNDRGIRLFGAYNNTVVNNNCSNCDSIGISSESGIGYSFIIDNHCNNNGLYGIAVSDDNHTIEGNNCSFNQEGIRIWGSNNNNITGNICKNNTINGGIHVWISDENSIVGNKCINNTGGGILVRNGINNEIIDNNCSFNQGGIALDDESNCTLIERNTCNNNSYSGIQLLYYSNYNTIINNTCLDNMMDQTTDCGGIFLDISSSHNQIINNTCDGIKNIGSGLGLGILINDVNCVNNTIMGSPFLNNDKFIKDEGTNTTIEIYCSTQAEIEAVLDSESANILKMVLVPTTIVLTSTINIDGGGRYVIEGQGDATVIDCNGDRTAFNITNTQSCELHYFNINGFLVSNERIIISINETNYDEIMINGIGITGNDKNGHGVRIYSGNTTIKECTFNKLNISIYITGGNDNLITDSHFSSNSGCIYILCLDDVSFYNQISRNTLTDSSVAILIASFYNATGFNTISGNIINGLYTNRQLLALAAGISITSTHYNNITGNILVNNINDYDSPSAAISVYRSSNNTITGNFIANNSNVYPGQNYYGIYSYGAIYDDKNWIFNNIMTGNDIQAYTWYIYDFWNNTEIGNFWGDYTGVDSDFDGIGDIPYNVTGIICDWLPIWNSDIELISPMEGSIVSQHPPSFSLIFHDLNVNATWYSLDGGLTNYSFSGEFTINAEAWAALWEDYTEGDPIIITFYFNTTYGYSVSKSFTLYGQYIHPPDYTSLILGLLIGGVSILAVSIILFMRNKIKNRPKKWTPSEDQVGEEVVEGRFIEYDDI